jgi:epoxyqueuosine reductase
LSLKTKLKEYAHSLGINCIGIDSADRFISEEAILHERIAEKVYPSFVTDDASLRSDVRKHIPKAQSIISIAVPYEHSLITVINERTGYLAKYARTQADYHEYLKQKLTYLADFLKKLSGRPIETHLFVDNGPLLERAIAVRAGLGWQGKNCCLIVPEVGSWVVLGEIVTDLKLTPDQPVKRDCGNCTQCIQACPTGALTPYKLNPHRCISYLTQMPGIIPKELRPLMGQNIFGCDHCQSACPFNRTKTDFPTIPSDPALAEGLNLMELITLSKKRFEEKYAHTAFIWRGRNIIRRNACIAWGNARNRRGILPLIDLLQNDPSILIRGAAAWALGRMNSAQAEEGLSYSLKQERSPLVREEILSALAKKTTG